MLRLDLPLVTILSQNVYAHYAPFRIHFEWLLGFVLKPTLNLNGLFIFFSERSRRINLLQERIDYKQETRVEV